MKLTPLGGRVGGEGAAVEREEQAPLGGLEWGYEANDSAGALVGTVPRG